LINLQKVYIRHNLLCVELITTQRRVLFGNTLKLVYLEVILRTLVKRSKKVVIKKVSIYK